MFRCWVSNERALSGECIYGILRVFKTILLILVFLVKVLDLMQTRFFAFINSILHKYEHLFLKYFSLWQQYKNVYAFNKQRK